MCGISGIISHNIDLRNINPAFQKAILFRGRDETGTWSDEEIILNHSRLIILDRHQGQQPMQDSTGRYVIVYNGEIYNYLELKKEYEVLGSVFQTQSDTEVLLEGYKQKGTKVFTDLNGMFACAIWDRKEQTLILARDRLGKKPLFWCQVGEAVYFSSTLFTFKKIPGFDSEVDPLAICELEAFGGLIAEKTIYKNAFAIPRASYAILQSPVQKPVITRYWEFEYHQKSKAAFTDLCDEYETLLIDAIKIRLRSDMPIALTFSGGVDSGTIAALCQKKLQVNLPCFTMDDHTPDNPSPEVARAKQVAQLFDLPWTYIPFDHRQVLDPEALSSYQYFDQPCVQIALTYSRLLYQAIKPQATVVISGNGCDEIFTGYCGDESIRRKDYFLKMLRWVSRFYKIPRYQKYLHSFSSAMKENTRTLILQNGRPAFQAEIVSNKMEQLIQNRGVTNFTDLASLLNLEIYSRDSNFIIPDIAGMSAGVEVRSPYLDYRMIEFSTKLPPQYKIASPFLNPKSKYLPKVVYSRFVPKEIAWGPKMGMGHNMNWHTAIASDSRFIKAFETAFDALPAFNIEAKPYKMAWQGYRKDLKSGKVFSPHATLMMLGFMLGLWIKQQEA